MARNITASDRKSLIRLASTMPKGSPERKAILAGLSRSARMAWSSDSGPEWFRAFLKGYAKWGGGRVRGKTVIDFSDNVGKATSRFDFREWSRDYTSKKLTEHHSYDSGSDSFSIMVSEGMTPDEAVRKMSDKARGQ